MKHSYSNYNSNSCPGKIVTFKCTHAFNSIDEGKRSNRLQRLNLKKKKKVKEN